MRCRLSTKLPQLNFVCLPDLSATCSTWVSEQVAERQRCYCGTPNWPSQRSAWVSNASQPRATG